MTLHEALDILCPRFTGRAGRLAWDSLSGLDLDRFDLESPIVVGCLLALLREAVAPWAPGGRGALTGWEGPPTVGAWYVYVQTGPGARTRFDGRSEGEAIAAALVWLATVGAPVGAP